MLPERLRRTLVLVHRWTALLLTPVFLVILLSGAVLALRPVLQGEPAAGMAAGDFSIALQRLDPQQRAGSASLSDDGTALLLGGSDGRFRHALSEDGPAAGEPVADPFAVALQLHKNLLIGAGALVEAASYAMVLLIALGLWFGWPKLRNTLMGWHAGLGWLALPLVALTPVTAVLMILHVGATPLPPPVAGPPLSLAAAVEAADRAGVPPVVEVRRFKGSSVLVTGTGEAGPERYLVTADGSAQRLTGGPGLPKALHEGTWAGAYSGILNLFSALALLGLTVTGLLSWLRRHRERGRREADAGADLLVAYASQTGTAASLARLTAERLRAAGRRVACASLDALRPADLPRFHDALLIAATTGEGDVPDSARGFLAELRTAGSGALSAARFDLLALGDRRYARFCGGGASLRAALLGAGAREDAPCLEADGDPAPIWRAWLERAGRRLGLELAPDAAEGLAGDRPLDLVLREKTRLDDPAVPGLTETWRLAFAAEGPAPAFRPGDLLLVAPDAGSPPRCYSIGSSSRAGDGLIAITVALHRWTDEEGRERLGRASSYLCRTLQPGARLAARLRPHPGFNPPEDPSRPLILVAAGAGIAPFPGFVAERGAGGGPVWLMFGNRRGDWDFFYRREWERYLESGALTRLDTAFSREQPGRRVQSLLLEHADDVIDWLANRNGVLYTCGRASTVAAGVEDALKEALARQGGRLGADPEATLRQWKAEGRLRVDAFA